MKQNKESFQRWTRFEAEKLREKNRCQNKKHQVFFKVFISTTVELSSEIKTGSETKWVTRQVKCFMFAEIHRAHSKVKRECETNVLLKVAFKKQIPCLA